MEKNLVAKTILEQLGGQKFIVMTGAKNFFYVGSNGLTFKIGRNKTRANTIVIKLNSKDLYDMELYRIDRNANEFKISEANDVYCDQLQEIFTSETGLYTSL